VEHTEDLGKLEAADIQKLYRSVLARRWTCCISVSAKKNSYNVLGSSASEVGSSIISLPGALGTVLACIAMPCPAAYMFMAREHSHCMMPCPSTACDVCTYILPRVQVLVIVILVPSLAVSVGLVLLSVALMRYLHYLKRSHDAIHLTEAWKRRNPPGLISDGNDRVLREVSRRAGIRLEQ